jgi:hypothetical protein
MLPINLGRILFERCDLRREQRLRGQHLGHRRHATRRGREGRNLCWRVCHTWERLHVSTLQIQPRCYDGHSGTCLCEGTLFLHHFHFYEYPLARTMLHICLLGLLRILDRFQQAARFSPVAVCPSLIHFSLDPVKQCGALHKCREHGLYFGSCPTFGHKILRPHRGCNIIPAYLSKLFWEELWGRGRGANGQVHQQDILPLWC